MILRLSGWVLDVDLEATMEYSAAEAAEHCDCAYCRNFYAAVDPTHPGLRPFLAGFGVDIEAPEELMPFTPTQVLSAYAVQGRILERGGRLPAVDGIPVRLETPEEAMAEADSTGPYFIVTAGPMDLPWVLEEEMEEVISPANTESFFQRMWSRVLGLFQSPGEIS